MHAAIALRAMIVGARDLDLLERLRHNPGRRDRRRRTGLEIPIRRARLGQTAPSIQKRSEPFGGAWESPHLGSENWERWGWEIGDSGVNLRV
jgi:hypothetical protein